MSVKSILATITSLFIASGFLASEAKAFSNWGGIEISSSDAEVALLYSEETNVFFRRCKVYSVLGETLEMAKSNCHDYRDDETTFSFSYLNEKMLDAAYLLASQETQVPDENNILRNIESLRVLSNWIKSNCPGVTDLSQCKNVSNAKISEYIKFKEATETDAKVKAKFVERETYYQQFAQTLIGKLQSNQFSNSLQLGADERRLAVSAVEIIEKRRDTDANVKSVLNEILQSISASGIFGSCTLSLSRSERSGWNYYGHAYYDIADKSGKLLLKDAVVVQVVGAYDLEDKASRNLATYSGSSEVLNLCNMPRVGFRNVH